MDRTGSNTKIRIVAAVISVAAFAAACSAIAEPQLDEHARRQAALTWAVSERQAALRAVLGPATRADVVLPVCRAVTIRPSTLSSDRREFHILIKEACDHSIKAAAVTVMQTPLTVQLAEMKFANDALTVESAIPQLKFKRVQLPPARGKQILELLDRARVTFTPLQAFVLDTPGVEVSVSSWGELRVVTYLSDTRPGWKELNAALRETLRLSDINLDRLRFDPSSMEK